MIARGQSAPPSLLLQTGLAHEVACTPSEDMVVPPFLHYGFGVHWCKRPLDGSYNSVTEHNDNNITTGFLLNSDFRRSRNSRSACLKRQVS